MRMLTIGFRRGLAAALAGAVLLVGALACASGDSAATASLTADVDDVKRMSQDNYVQLGVFEERIARLEKENSQLSGRIAQLESDKEALLEVVNSLAALAPGGAEILSGAAAMAAGMTALSNEPLTRDTATDEQRATVSQWVECSLKSSGMSDTLIQVAAGPTVDATWVEIENGTQSFSDIEASIGVMCAGQ